MEDLKYDVEIVIEDLEMVEDVELDEDMESLFGIVFIYAAY